MTSKSKFVGLALAAMLLAAPGARAQAMAEGASSSCLPRGFFEKDFTWYAAPARVGVREKMADVLLAERAEDGVADGVHERVGVRMAVEAFGVGNLHAAEDEFAPRDELMNIVANANVNHAVSLGEAERGRKLICCPATSPRQRPVRLRCDGRRI